MRLVKFFCKDNKITLNTAALKRASGVSDFYWNELYKPFINSTEQTLQVLDRSELFNTYQSSLKSVMLKCKGVALKESIYTHMFNFAAALSYTCIYLAELSSKYKFIAISNNKKTFGDRNEFLPWLELPICCDYKIVKRDVSLDPSIIIFGILSTISPRSIWVWLYSNPNIYAGFISSLRSMGQEGMFSEVMPLEFENASVDTFTHEKDLENRKPSIDDLLAASNVGEEIKTLFDDINETNSPSDVVNTSNEVHGSKTEVVDDLGFDFSIFNSPATDAESEEAVVEIQSECEYVNDVKTFFVKLLKSQSDKDGFYYIKHNGLFYVVIDQNVGLDFYIDSEYSEEDKVKAKQEIKSLLKNNEKVKIANLVSIKGEIAVFVLCESSDAYEGVPIYDATIEFEQE